MILVTGATGLVGAHLLQKLTDAGKQVRAMKRKGSSLALVEKVFRRAGKESELPRIEWVNADLLDIFSLDRALLHIDEVYHCGAMVSFHPSARKQMLKVNIEGTANMVNASLDAGVKKFCHVSSVAALGRSSSNQYINEESLWKNSKRNSIYAKSKYGAEKEVWRGMAEGLNAVIVNPSIIFGAGNWQGGSTELIKVVWKGFPFYTTGVNSFVDVRDVVRAMILLMEGDHFGERFVITSENQSYRQVFIWIAGNLRRKPPTIPVTPFMAEIAWRLFMIKARLTGGKSAITRETARTSTKRYYYSAEKLKQRIDIEFISVKHSIEDSCRVFLDDIQGGILTK